MKRGRVIKEEIGIFNPFRLPNFSCPVCGKNRFVELRPYGGVWCENCNAKFQVQGTSDGPRKLSVRCITTHVYKSKMPDEVPPAYGTVVWSDDKTVSWMPLKRAHR